MHTEFWSENMKGRELGRPRRSWEDNIRMDLRKVGWKFVVSIDVDQDRDQ
jgi:hypothetical protein